MATGTELLQKAVMFKDLDGDELDQVANVCREENFAPGEYIFRECERGNRLCLVIEGDSQLALRILLALQAGSPWSGLAPRSLRS